ncbi:MAG: hypothetical protein BWY95_01567 [Bacteroidetes bacterium ADurb.BinA104]|nr:MAG: hypothetical protein BWY95_01567 [Bacteroidetes bacterium ADurb.BinA104]
MARKKIIKTDDETIKETRGIAEEWQQWETLSKSSSGKFFLNWLNAAIEETLDNEDRTDIYKMDAQAREYFFASVRSKRQTLKAIKDKLIKSSEERQRWASELHKLVPENQL